MKNKELILLILITIVAFTSNIKMVSAGNVVNSIPRFYGDRYTIKSMDAKLDNEYIYVSFSDGILFEDKEIYVARASYNHFTKIDLGYGKIVFFVRDKDSSDSKPFQLVYPNIDYDKYEDTYGEFRDANLSTTNIPGIFLLSCSTAYNCNSEGKNCMHTSLLMVMKMSYENSELKFDVLSDYMFMTEPKDDTPSRPVSRMPFGNALTTPDGHLLQTIYGSGKTYLYRSNEVFTGTLENMTFKYIKSWGGDTTVSNSSGDGDDFDDDGPYDIDDDVYINGDETVGNGTTTLAPSETTIGYFNDKLVIMFRNDQDGSDYASYIAYTDDLEGTKSAVWTNPIKITDNSTGKRMVIHSPVLLQSYTGDTLLFAGSLYTSTINDIKYRYPIIGKIDITTGKVTGLDDDGNIIIDENISDYSGYPSLVPTADGYGMMYYEDNQKLKTALYFKDIEKTTSKIVVNDNNSSIYGTYVMNKLDYDSSFTYGDLNSKFTITDQNLVVKNKDGATVTSDSQKVGTNSKIILSDQEYTLILTGDANGDGMSNIDDAKKLAQDIVDKKEFSKIDMYASDLTNDSIIKMNDVMKMVVG